MNIRNRIGIASVGSYSAEVTDKANDIKAMLVDAGEPRPRRTSRFIDLALLGASKAIGERSTLPPQCGMFIASEQPNLCDTGKMLAGILQRGEAPMPFDFINVSNNMAGYHIARRYGLEGTNMAITRCGAAFESALEIALLQLDSGAIPMALVGAVDECCQPLSLHRSLVQLNTITPLAEGSSWLLLVTGEEAKRCSIWVEGYQHCADWNAVSAYIQQKSSLCGNVLIADEEIAKKVKAIGSVGEHRWFESPGLSPTESAYALTSILAGWDQTAALYIYGDEEGGYLVLLIGGTPPLLFQQSSE